MSGILALLRLLVAPLLILGYLMSPAFASDFGHLEENLPTELEDADPIELGGREFQVVVRYLDEGGEGQMWYQPEFDFGIFPHTQLSVAATFLSGSADRTGSGNVSGELLYNFKRESALLPAMALAVEVEFPTGLSASGVDLSTVLILSKMPVPASPRHPRFHLNAIWTRNAGRDRQEEREDLFTWILGYSMRVGAASTLILDLIREQKEEKREEANVAEIGVRHQLARETVLAIGGGVGFGDASERYRVTLGIEREF